MQVLHRTSSHHASSHAGTTHDRPRSAPTITPAGRFGLHFMEMCAVMCVGGGLLIGLFVAGAALLGFSDVRSEHPVVSALASACLLALAMVAWMRWRRMEWRPTLEMAASSIVVGVVLVVGFQAGLVSRAALFPAVCGVACVAMLAVMFLRLDLYTSDHSAHARHSGSSSS